jgi:hypothetical protein
LLPVLAIAQDGAVLDNAREIHGVYTLAPGPNVEGVVYLRQCYDKETGWPPDVVQAFHNVPWIDAASIRMRWANLEPREHEYDWGAIDKVLAEVKKYNAAHPGVRRTMHIRVMGGEHSPKWFEQAGVRYYDTIGGLHNTPLHIPMPYDNPEFLKRLRAVYRAMYERYKDEPLVTVYHGTWSAGPWDEIFHPDFDEPLPPGYTRERFVQGMIEQLDVLIDEFCMRGKVAELSYSGRYPHKPQIDITGPLTARIVERLGRRSPFLYIQTNGWGQVPPDGPQTILWHHEGVIDEAYGVVNLAFQALGDNARAGNLPQGDWVHLVQLAEKYEIGYAEIYFRDFMPVDEKHRMVEAFTQSEGAAGAGAVPGFVGFRPWLKQRHRVLYAREGTVRKQYRSEAGVQPIDLLMLAADVPARCSVTYRARTRQRTGDWSAWKAADRVSELPPGDEAEIEARMHTDDGYFTPRIIRMRPAWHSLTTSINPY